MLHLFSIVSPNNCSLRFICNDIFLFFCFIFYYNLVRSIKKERILSELPILYLLVNNHSNKVFFFFSSRNCRSFGMRVIFEFYSMLQHRNKRKNEKKYKTKSVLKLNKFLINVFLLFSSILFLTSFF